jgi:hypothetical protein
VTRALDDRRLRLALLAAVLVAAALSVAAFLARGSDKPPASRSATLVPADALVFAHLSTDGDREAVRDALSLAKRFPSWPRLRDQALARIGAQPGERGLRDLRKFVGDEAGVAFLNVGVDRADLLVLLRITDESKARSYLATRSRPVGSTPYRGTRITNYGSTQGAFVKGFLALGPFEAVSAAVDLGAGRSRSLASSPLYRRAAGDLPDDRVADGWVSADGVRRLLMPAGGVLGTIGALLDRPGLRGTSLALSPAGDGVKVRVRAALAKGAPRPTPFSPTLLDSVPARAVAALDTTRLDLEAPRLLGLSSARGPVGRGFARLAGLARGRREGPLRDGLLGLARGESALSVLAGARGPVLTLLARVRDQRATSAAIARVHGRLARALAGRRPGSPPPAFRPVRVAGRTAFRLDVPRRLTVVYTVSAGKIVLSTDPQGVAAALGPGPKLADSKEAGAVLSDRPDRVTSLLFLDFSQLLGLTRRAGLAGDSTFARYQADLAKLGAIGAVSSAQGDIASTELSIKFK